MRPIPTPYNSIAFRIKQDLVFATGEGQPLIRLNIVQKHFQADTPNVRNCLQHFAFTTCDMAAPHFCSPRMRNPKVVSERLGHASITLTMDTYSHVMPNMQQGASDKLEQMLFHENWHTKRATQF